MAMSESTNLNKNQQIFSLREVDLLAMEMRSHGTDLKTISGLVDVKYGTVRSWFMDGGRLNKAYQKHLEEQTKARLEQATRAYQECLGKAMRVLIALLDNEQPRVRYLAATKIIDWNLGTEGPEEPVQDPVQEILEAMGVLKDENSHV